MLFWLVLRSGAYAPKLAVSQEMPSPFTELEVELKPMLWLADRDCEPWYVDDVEDPVTGMEFACELDPFHQPVVFVEWKSGDEEKEPKSTLGDVSEPQAELGMRLDGGGVCKVERDALVMYAPDIPSPGNWKVFVMPF